MHRILLLLFLFSFSFTSLAHSHLSNVSDEHALLSFKHYISHDSLNALSNWSPNINFCSWEGVECSSHHHRVAALNLTGLGLQGSISPFLANLSFIRVIDLSYNNFSGHIPNELGRLLRLRELWLHSNQLEGSIPTTLSACSNLVVLALSYNHVSGSIPAELGTLPNLERLYLGANDLSGAVPSSLGNISTLIELKLGPNHLQGHIPSELGLLIQLEVLYIHENHLTGTIPSSLSNISSLTDLALYTNNLTGAIPPQFGLLTQLWRLYLHENHLIGEIPTSLLNLTGLQYLGLSQLKLTGHIPLELGAQLTNLEEVYLWGNQLSGSIPNSIANCSQLRELDLEQNQLSGPVPTELGKLQLLEFLDLSLNQLVSGSSTTLPFLTALTNCSFLQRLILYGNRLSGVLPSTIGQLSPRLSILFIDTNDISGSIPPQIGNLTNLKWLDLSTNRFSGSIPSAIGRLVNLERLSFDNNILRGRIPSEIGELKGLGMLSFTNNMLSGRIPDTIGNLQQLRDLYLDQNQLSGKIPVTLAKCSVLELLDLAGNKLSGRIPSEVAGLSNLQFYFNLSRNSLQGPLPAEISKMEHVLAIDISVNQLSGHIPATLGSCSELQTLNLSRNALQGPIPRSLGELKSMESLDFSSNYLSGRIPESLETLKMLNYLNFSFNNLTGEIPKGGVFANITSASFMGNPDLCGQWIHLPACPLVRRNKKPNYALIKIIAAAVIGVLVFCICCLVLVFYRRHYLHLLNLDISEAIARHKRISYAELVNATDGFSESNLLGTGSFGSVYRGVLHDGTIVAVKVFNLLNEAAAKSFTRECRILGRVRHRNLVRIITSCSNLQFKGLVLKFMPKGSLETCLYGHGRSASDGEDVCRLSFRERLSIAIDIAHGIQYLHHDCFMQIVHCDIKPSNVLLDDTMTGHVTDFGIARLTCVGDSMDSLTSTLGRGSLGYIAPEYGVGGRISTKSDVYSYGIVLLEMLTRKRPTSDMFVGELNLRKWVYMNFQDTLMEVVDEILVKEMSDEGMEEDEIRNCVSSVIKVGLVCTKESPLERPSMREVVGALENIRSELIAGGGAALRWAAPLSALIGNRRAQIRDGGTSDSQTSSTV